MSWTYTHIAQFFREVKTLPKDQFVDQFGFDLFEQTKTVFFVINSMQVITLNLVFIYGSFNMFIVALMADRSHVNSQNLVTTLEEQVRHDHPQRKILRTNHSTGKHSVQPQKPLFSLTPGLIQVLVFGLCFVCMQHIPCSLPSRAVCIKC